MVFGTNPEAQSSKNTLQRTIWSIERKALVWGDLSLRGAE
ncbi:hypothetical protein HBZS_120920 [Helicobacter bizzozeronii CCUG 35545]|nr:hypothetical protein HBZS_120920 [Helicobacter bizzozeronii CCUG 35545]